MMKRRRHVAIFISMLLPLSLTACASASKVKLNTVAAQRMIISAIPSPYQVTKPYYP